MILFGINWGFFVDGSGQAYETKCMSLQYALLVSLAEQEATGYELTRRFDKSLGFFWRATHQQIYRVLAGMAQEGLLTVREEKQAGKPDRRVYSLTPEGRSALVEHSRRRVGWEPVRNTFAVKVRGLPFSDAEAVLTEIREQRELHREQLAYYEANCAKNYPDPSVLDADDLPRYLVLRGGIRTERAMVEWCDEMLAMLSAQGPKTGSAS